MQIGNFVFDYQPLSMNKNVETTLSESVSVDGVITSTPENFSTIRHYIIYLFEDSTYRKLENFRGEIKKGKTTLIDEFDIKHEVLITRVSNARKLTAEPYPVYRIELEVDLL